MVSQVFELRHAGRQHRLVATDVGLRRQLVWTSDGAEVASKSTMDDRVTLKPSATEAVPRSGPVRGRLEVRSGLTGVRRATLTIDGADIDLVPEAGSPAARREDRIRAHPHRHVVLHTVGALARVLVPLLGIGLVLSWLPDWDLPGLPMPHPDLPDVSIDLPSIPWPDWDAPAWLATVRNALAYVVPVLVAFGIARREVKRRHEQDARRRGGRPQGGDSPH